MQGSAHPADDRTYPTEVAIDDENDRVLALELNSSYPCETGSNQAWQFG